MGRKSRMSSNVILPGGIFRNVLILESRDWWQAVQATYDPTRDLVLTYDFGLRKEVEALGGTVRYVDHLCEQGVMQANNFLMYQFFGDWHKDSSGRDIFRYREVDFGFSFRIEIWNDFTFYVRGRLCLEQLRTISYQTVIVGSSQGLIGDVLKDMGLDFQSLEQPAEFSRQAYFFPVHRWMNERLRIRRVRHVIRDVVVAVQGVVMSWIDRVAEYFSPTVRIYVQEYYPTKELLQCLKRESGIRVVQGHFSGVAGLMKFLAERPIPIYGSLNEYQKIAYLILAAFQQQRSARLVLSNGIDVTSQVNQVIEQRVAEVLPGMLRTLDCVIRYLNRHPIQLEILIANLGQVAMLVDCVAKSRGVPSFLIINGLLSSEYLDEGKYATVINSYSESIRDHYFRGMGNVVCLGDPRMDAYALASPRMINRTLPTITIGASGFNNVDLNSYLAVEFEFLNDVLSAIRNLSNATRSFRVILKIRANGYHDAYRRFAAEYFPGIVDSIIDNAPMRAVLEQTDFFVSIFSQTLFEASCLGIPSVYHKNDREIMDPPFDGKSELVTTYDVAGLEQAILDFLSGSDRFDAFLDKQVMEKYVGPLDGGNLERNLRFTHGLLGKCQGGRGERR
jgi:hypothetical protein